MSDVDPVLLAWRIVSETERPDRLTTAQIAAAALNGTTALAPEHRDALLLQRSEKYEALLVRMWDRHGLPPDLVGEAASWPATGALGAALREHAQRCDSTTCRAVADAWKLQEHTAPSVLDAIKAAAREAMTRAGAVLREVFAPPRILVANEQSPGDERAVSDEDAGRFGPGIRLLANPEDPRQVRVIVDFDRLRELQGRDVVVVVLREDDAEPLARLVFPGAAGRQRETVDIDSELIRQRRLRVAVGVMEESG